MQLEITSRMLDRFWPKVAKSDRCWQWTGTTMPPPSLPYGTFFLARVGYRSRSIGAHRFSYLVAHGEIPGHLCVLHSCDNAGCVRPSHLFLGTKLDNSRDMVAKGRGRWPGNTSGIFSRGETRPAHKLTWGQVRTIRQCYSFRKVTLKQLAEQYEVSKTTVFMILHNKAWIEHQAPTVAM